MEKLRNAKTPRTTKLSSMTRNSIRYGRIADRENPLGWRDGGKLGSKQECLAFIKDVWTDMTPLSLRRKRNSGAQTRDAQPGTPL